MEQDTQKINEIAYALMIGSARDELDIPGEYIWNIPEKNNFEEIRAKSRSVFSSGNSIKDKQVLQFIQGINAVQYLKDPWISKKFEEYFHEWVSACTRFNLKGFDQFKEGCFAQGSQEYFLNFYLRNRTKRFRIHRGEYWWHMEVWKNLGMEWTYIDEGDITSNDVVIVSTPFALTGKVHKDLENTITLCEKHNAELMLDFIYLPNLTTENFEIDLNYECIKTISFSLSKTFPVQNAKIAIRFSRKKINDPMQISNDENVANRLSCGIGLEVMQRFEIDYMAKKYHSQQIHWCNVLGLIPTDVVHFASGAPYTRFGRTVGQEFFSEFNNQHTRYNLGPLFENTNFLKKAGYYE